MKRRPERTQKKRIILIQAVVKCILKCIVGHTAVVAMLEIFYGHSRILIKMLCVNEPIGQKMILPKFLFEQTMYVNHKKQHCIVQIE